MTFYDRPLPENLHLPKLQHRGTQNLMREGRIPGAVNRISKDVKQGILNGAIAHGADGKGKDGLEGYLCMCAARFPKHYLSVLAKLLPTHPSEISLSGPHITSISVVSVPSGSYLSAEDMARMPAGVQMVEHVPQTEPAEIGVPETPQPEEPTIDVESSSLDELLAQARRAGLAGLSIEQLLERVRQEEQR